LEVLDAGGNVVRTYATDPEEAGNEDLSELPTPEAGLNRFAWDFRTESLPAVEGLVPFGSLRGRQLPPGDYQVRLTHGETSMTVPLLVAPDPRRTATQEQYVEQDRVVAQAQEAARDLYGSVLSMRSVHEQVEENVLVQPDQKTFQDVINFVNQLDAQLLALIQSVDGTEPPVTQGARDRLRDLTDAWAGHARTRDAIFEEDLEAFERLLDELGIPHVVLPMARSGSRPIAEDGGDRR
jgi:hypothetical protein